MSENTREETDFRDRLAIFIIAFVTMPIWLPAVGVLCFSAWLMVGAMLLAACCLLVLAPFGYLLDDGSVIFLPEE